MMKNYDELKYLLEKYNQSHLLKFYQELDGLEQEKLLEDISNIDFEEINHINNNQQN